jgi:hypothetical protein
MIAIASMVLAGGITCAPAGAYKSSCASRTVGTITIYPPYMLHDVCYTPTFVHTFAASGHAAASMLAESNGHEQDTSSIHQHPLKHPLKPQLPEQSKSEQDGQENVRATCSQHTNAAFSTTTVDAREWGQGV